MFNSFTKNFSTNTSVKRFLTSALVTLSTLAPAQSLMAASIEIGLVIDGSGSISGSDFALQRDAYVNIFSNDFVGNFLTGDVDTVFASFWQFSSGVVQEVSWTEIMTNAEALSFANDISLVTQSFGGTNTAGAISTVAASIVSNGINADSQVIDISSDGEPNNQLAAVNAASDAFDNDNIITNTLFVGTSSTGQSNLADIATAGGGDAFIANNFTEYQDALQEKLELEFSNPNPNKVPESSTLIGLFTLGFLAITSNRKYNRA